MQTDIEGAIRVARLASSFDWTWTSDNLDNFSTTVGWHAQRYSSRSVTFQTGLNLGRDWAEARFDRHRLATTQPGQDVEVSYARVSISDRVDPDDLYSREELVDIFAEMHGRLVAELGSVSRRNIGSTPGLVWDLPNQVLVLDSGSRLTLSLNNPVYCEWRDRLVSVVEAGDLPEDDDDLEDLPPRPSSWPQFVRALALTVAFMPEDSAISLSAPTGSKIYLRMNEFHVEVVIHPVEGDLQFLDDLRPDLAQLGWIESVDRFGNHLKKSVEWPSPMHQFGGIAESAMTTLRSISGIATPANIEIESWAIRGDNTADISLLGSGL
ncbi:DUF6301 family protein [Nocardia salmonicida]|uniref:DUF6301 family protein n=1 Tax=Nocardia salmonicida TaxID=53431 RepID=UPI00365CCD07